MGSTLNRELSVTASAHHPLVTTNPFSRIPYKICDPHTRQNEKKCIERPSTIHVIKPSRLKMTSLQLAMCQLLSRKI